MNVPLNPIEHSLFCFALSAILRVNLRMSQIYGNLFERPPFSPGIHANSNRSAGSEGGEEQIIGRESCIRAACRHRFISSYSMTARDNFLSEARGTATNHYLTHVTPLRFSFALLVRAGESSDPILSASLHQRRVHKCSEHCRPWDEYRYSAGRDGERHQTKQSTASLLRYLSVESLPCLESTMPHDANRRRPTLAVRSRTCHGHVHTLRSSPPMGQSRWVPASVSRRKDFFGPCRVECSLAGWRAAEPPILRRNVTEGEAGSRDGQPAVL